MVYVASICAMLIDFHRRTIDKLYMISSMLRTLLHNTHDCMLSLISYLFVHCASSIVL